MLSDLVLTRDAGGTFEAKRPSRLRVRDSPTETVGEVGVAALPMQGLFAAAAKIGNISSRENAPRGIIRYALGRLHQRWSALNEGSGLLNQL